MKEKKTLNYYSAPGRVCLYGEHQDYLKLIVVPAAINLRTKIGLKLNQSNSIKVKSQELKTEDKFDINHKISLKNNEYDYLRAIIIILIKEGIIEKIPGFDIEILSEVPIGSGLSSSAALLVSWLTALNEELNLALDKKEIADICFKAENQVLGINCGIMDQYASSLGGIFSLNCDGPPFEIQKYQTVFPEIVIGDSLVRRAANEPLTFLKNQLNNGIKRIQENKKDILKTLSFDELEKYKGILSVEENKRLNGVITIREITKQACQELSKKKNHDHSLLGTLLTEQQKALRDYLEVSTPELDKLIKISLENGALGAKLTGAGFGGCIIVYAPDKEKEVAEAINRAGGKAIICKVDPLGSKREMQ
ncbi:MAG: hypothetical protein EAX90_12440 [Candidatus Heimdallarchaeota archaeon]|nr:hypothetical protein [Candidatus Heimdallarchaeota archaeon]